MQNNVITLNQEESNVRRIPTNRDRAQEIGFTNVYEMTKYTQGQILDSKMKFKDIAKKADVGTQTVSRLAYGETKDPRIKTVIHILIALGRTIYVR